MRTRSGILLVVLLLVCAVSLSHAQQQDVSLTIFQTALDLAKHSCPELGRNQACYGHDLLSAEPRPEVNPFHFSDVGDVEELAKIKSLRLGGLNVSAGTWGIALMQLRADLSASHPENVTLVAFGDVTLENAVLPPTRAEIQVHAQQNVNVRQRPVMSAGVIGTLTPGQTVTVVDRLSDSSWLRVMLPESNQTGWVLAALMSSTPALSGLNITTGDAPYIQEPMQAFYFSSNSNASGAVFPMPTNGLIIQTPEGVGEVNLLINEVSVQLGSTVFFQTEPGQQMTIATLEGHADVRTFGIEQTAFAGTQVTVPLTSDHKPSGPPSPPQPYDQALMDQLPVGILNRPVTAAQAMTYEEIQQQMFANSSGNGQDDPNAADSEGSNTLLDTDNSNSSDCPGQSCDAPGHGGSCPGNSCDAPGQNKDENEKKAK